MTEAVNKNTVIDLDQASVGDFFELLKPRVMSLVIFSAFTGVFLAPVQLPFVMSFAAILFIAIGAGASGALNMWYDADIDSKMLRTRQRPIPSGRISAGSVLTYGIVLSIISVMCLGIFLNWFAAGLLLFTIFFYAVVYTIWLKRVTPQNIVIGGFAGALPPVIGWVSVTGSISLYPILLCLIILFWTPPHFWALALLKQEEYAKVGIPMMPNVIGEKRTRFQIVVYTLILSLLSISPYYLGFTGKIYGVAAILLATIFLGLAIRLYMASLEKRDRIAKILFFYSILYLFVLFILLCIDSWIGG